MQEKYAKTDESITQAFKDLDALIAKVFLSFELYFYITTNNEQVMLV